MELRTPPAADSANTQALADELVRAADMLYTVGERDLAASFVSDLAEQSGNAATLAALGELTGRRNHAHAMLEIGRIALARGLAVDPYAFPTIGIPQQNPIGPAIDRSRSIVSGLYAKGPKNVAGRQAIAALPTWTTLNVTTGGAHPDTFSSATAPGRKQENGGEDKGRATPHVVTAAGR